MSLGLRLVGLGPLDQGLGLGLMDLGLEEGLSISIIQEIGNIKTRWWIYFVYIMIVLLIEATKNTVLMKDSNQPS